MVERVDHVAQSIRDVLRQSKKLGARERRAVCARCGATKGKHIVRADGRFCPTVAVQQWRSQSATWEEDECQRSSAPPAGNINVGVR